MLFRSVVFTVSATGYGVSERIRLFVDGSEINTYNYANSAGEVSFNYTLPLAAGIGRHAIELVDSTNLRVGGSIIANRPAQTLTLSGNPTLGTELSLIATGFKSGETVSFTMNGVALSGTKSADTAGMANYTIANLTVSSSTYVFTATGNSGTAVASWSADTSDQLVLDYTGMIEPGKAYNIKATGLLNGATLKAYINQQPVVFDPVVVAANVGGVDGVALFSITLPSGFADSTVQLLVSGEGPGNTYPWQSTNIPVSTATADASYSPASPAAGSNLTFNASGFSPEETINLWVEGKQIGIATTSVAGSASIAWMIPLATQAGQYTFTLIGLSSRQYVKKSITISAYQPSVTAPSTAKAGEQITVSATGLADGELMFVLLNGAQVDRKSVV